LKTKAELEQTHREAAVREKELAERSALALKASNTSLEEKTKLLEQARESENAAYSAVNHCAKRVMNENVTWLQFLQKTVRPKQDADPELFRQELDEVVSQMLQENKEGFKRCRLVLTRQQLAEGSYMPNLQPYNIKALLEAYKKAKTMEIAVQENVPTWVLTDAFLLDICLENAVHNAYAHGEKDGVVLINVSMGEAGAIRFEVINKPGPNHSKGYELQKSKTQESDLHKLSKQAAINQMGQAQSSYLGLGEIATAAAALGATTSLTWQQDSVTFSLVCKMHKAPISELSRALPQLPNGMRLICADDDFGPRRAFEGLRKKLNISKECCVILGETHAEISNLVLLVLDTAALYGDRNVMLIIDQNLDKYAEGKFLGTEIIAELRTSGFQGMAFIRSSNDSAKDIRQYRDAGANGGLLKSGPVKDVVQDILMHALEAFANTPVIPVDQQTESITLKVSESPDSAKPLQQPCSGKMMSG